MTRKLFQYLFRSWGVVAVLALFSSSTFACTCIIDPLGKQYRNAKAIFVARGIDPANIPNDRSLIQGNGQQVVEVLKSWKGIKKQFVALNFERVESAGSCPLLYYLKPETKYLVFAYGHNLEVRSVCSDTQVIDEQNEVAQDRMRKLNSRWFRLRARFRLA